MFNGGLFASPLVRRRVLDVEALAQRLDQPGEQALDLAGFDAGARAQVLDRFARQSTVAREAADVVIDIAIVGDVGMTARDQALEIAHAPEGFPEVPPPHLIAQKLVHRLVEVQLPTAWGDFTLIAYRSDVEHEEQLALCKGGVGQLSPDGEPIIHDEPVLVRLHSECLTGDIFHSRRCDCGEQLEYAMKAIQKEKRGVLLYISQEGRGIGLAHKMRAYSLM